VPAKPGIGGTAGEEPVANHEASGTNAPPVRLDLAGSGEARLGLDHLDAEALEALNAVVGRDAGDDAVDVSVHLEEIDRGLVSVDAEATAGAHRVRRVGRRR
jgi:hypothetical protein